MPCAHAGAWQSASAAPPVPPVPPPRPFLARKSRAGLADRPDRLARQPSAGPVGNTLASECLNVPRRGCPRAAVGLLYVLVARPAAREVLGDDPFLALVQGGLMRRPMVGLARLVRRLPQPFDFLPDRGTTSSWIGVTIAGR